MMNSDFSCPPEDDGGDPFELAVQAHQSGRLAEAERRYRGILVEQPDDPIVRQLLGVTLLDAGRVDDAITELERSKELDPTDLLTLAQLGRAMFVAGRLRDAVAAWDRVWSTDRELLAELVPFHARALLDSGRFADAVAVASESLASDPGREEWRAVLLEVLSPAPEASIVEAALQTIDNCGAPNFIPWILTELTLRWVADGRSDLAIQCLQARHETVTDPVLARLLGGLLCQVGRLEDAIAPLQSSLALDPRDVECAVNLGAALAGLGRLDAAESVLRRACDLDPSRPEPRLNLAQVLIRSGRAESAVALLEEVRCGHPDRWDATLIHASALQKLGRDGEASRVLDDAIARGVRHPSLVLERSILATKLGERDLAESLLRDAMARPDAPSSVRLRLLDLLLESGRAEEVLALTLSDSFAEGRADVLVRIASAWDRLGRHDQAKLAASESLEMRPLELSSWFMLAWRFLQHRDPDRAIECLREVLARDPNNGQARANLAEVLMQTGRFEESLRTLPDRSSAGIIGARELATRAMSGLLLGELRGAAEATEAMLEGGLDPAAASNVLMTWNYPSGVDEGWLAAVHRRWGRSLGERSPRPAASPRVRLPDRPLRVGLVSGDFRQHSVASFLESWLPEGPLAGLDIVCFSNVEEPDEVTQRLRRLTPEWHEVSGLDDEGFAELARSSDLDALVDLSGHTSLGRLPAFRLQPAPCLISWLGYPNTTGLESVDFRLVDDLTDPPDQPWDGPERLLRMEAPFLCFHPSPESPPIRVPTDRPPTFGSFNNAFKLNRSTLESWARTISAIPEARLVLKARQFHSQELRDRVLATLQSGGLDAPRVELLADLPSQREHLVAYDRVDFALDPFPYHGTTTTCEALWMGVPVLTRIGTVHRSRVGLTLLRSAGVDWSIAGSEEEFRHLASLAARDVRVHRANRAALRDQVARSGLCDPRSFARRFSAAIRLAVKARTPRRA
jgi:protein O-GlcNAc transferase